MQGISTIRKRSPTKIGLKQPSEQHSERPSEDTHDGSMAGGYAIDKNDFEKLARDIAKNMGFPDLQFDEEALDVIQEAAEDHISGQFKDAGIITMTNKRTTVLPEDFKLAGRLRERR